jgi:hypothetical protein
VSTHFTSPLLHSPNPVCSVFPLKRTAAGRTVLPMPHLPVQSLPGPSLLCSALLVWCHSHLISPCILPAVFGAVCACCLPPGPSPPSAAVRQQPSGPLLPPPPPAAHTTQQQQWTWSWLAVQHWSS